MLSKSQHTDKDCKPSKARSTARKPHKLLMLEQRELKAVGDGKSCPKTQKKIRVEVKAEKIRLQIKTGKGWRTG